MITGDDGHETEYNVHWLVENTYTTESKQKTPPMLWDAPKIHKEPMPTVDYESYKNSESGIKETMFNLLKYGFSVVEGVRSITVVCFVLSCHFTSLFSVVSVCNFLSVSNILSQLCHLSSKYHCLTPDS